jgi:endoglucanase Acf2
VMPYRRHLVKSQCTEQISHHLLLGFYNDQHFHYGYHIYAASMVAHFRPNWGKEHFEEVLLLVRSIANPSKLDDAFPLFRHKDWYQGSSWASGIPLPPFLNGKNQESSSEAIAAYESVALFGQMAFCWRDGKSCDFLGDKEGWPTHDCNRTAISKNLLSC